LRIPEARVGVCPRRLVIPQAALSSLGGGTATFALTHKAPVFSGAAGTTDNFLIGGNGAGLDFSTLTLNQDIAAVPEPTSLTMVGSGTLFGLGV
jgi:hypothetical protein